MEFVKLTVKPREIAGTRGVRRLRKTGEIPAVIYGHDAPPQNIQVAKDEFAIVLKKGSRLIDLALGEKVEKALVKEVQWDALGDHIIHVDFARIDLKKNLQIEVELALKGIPEGTKEGGVLEQRLMKVLVKCLPTNIPKSIEVDVAAMKVDDVMHVKDLKFPEGVIPVTNPDVVVAGVRIPLEIVEPAVAELGAAEPEVITAKKPEEGEEAAAPAKGAAPAKAAAPAKEEKGEKK